MEVKRLSQSEADSNGSANWRPPSLPVGCVGGHRLGVFWSPRDHQPYQVMLTVEGSQQVCPPLLVACQVLGLGAQTLRRADRLSLPLAPACQVTVGG